MERDVADARPDLAILPSGLASSSFTWRDLAKHPVFTVGPVRGPGRDAWERFTRGAMGLAEGRVPIAAEDGSWLAHASGIALSGPYLVTDDEHGEIGIVERSAGERLAPEIARLSPRDRGGDHDVTGAIVRHYALARAGRLAAIGRADAALAELRRALWFLPEEERALVVHRGPASGSRAARPVVVVRDRGVFLTSRGDAVRSAAVLLDATGEASRADALLEAQEARGDVRARLERAWLAGARGDHETARALAQSALAESPDLAPDVEALLRSLRP
jgi:tetratricopeptide (TPR) repeat protein